MDEYEGDCNAAWNSLWKTYKRICRRHMKIRKIGIEFNHLSKEKFMIENVLEVVDNTRFRKLQKRANIPYRKYVCGY